MRLSLLFPGWILVLGCPGPETNIRTLTPELAVAPTALDFGQVVAGEESVTLDLFVQNVGAREMEVDLQPPDDAAFTFLGDSHLVVPVDASVTVPVTFTPSAVQDYESALLVATNDAEQKEPLAVPLVGVGRVPYAPDIQIDELTIDFGAVDPGETKTRFFQVFNVGDADLVLGSVTREGGGTFEVTDLSGFTIAPGDSRVVEVSYTALQPDGDSGLIHYPSNDPDPDEQVVDVSLIANGGGDFDYPVAVFDCPGTIDLLGGATAVELDGSASYDPLGQLPLTYDWTVIRRPAAADVLREVEPSDQAVGTLLIDAAGTWEVSLEVANALGTPSVPTKCVIEAIPVDQLHVELSWSGPTSDLDLHLALDDAPFYDVPGDVSWCNPTPDWGVPGSADDDGHLDLDDAQGFGPEQVGVLIPTADTTYAVRVHLFDDGEDMQVTANVSVFTNGALEWSGSKVMNRNEVWDVGQINWPEGTFGVGNTDPWDAEGTRECAQ